MTLQNTLSIDVTCRTDYSLMLNNEQHHRICVQNWRLETDWWIDPCQNFEVKKTNKEQQQQQIKNHSIIK